MTSTVDPITVQSNLGPKKVKLLVKHGTKALITVATLFLIVIAVLTLNHVVHLYNPPIPHQSLLITPVSDANLWSNIPGLTIPPTASLTFHDPEAEPCEHISDRPDPCEFVRTNENCASEGLVNWLEFRYCTLQSKAAPVATLITIAILLFLLTIFLSSLGSTADVFFVPALSSFANDVKMSPAVSGLTLVSIGNASPDVLSTISTVASGDIGMVLGALTGAAVCISLLAMGAAIFASPEGKTTLSKFSFIRSMIGYSICIGSTIVLGFKGSFTLFNAIIFLSLYFLYVIVNVIYLQSQEAKVRKLRELKRRKTFLHTTTSFHLLKEQYQNQSGVFEAPEPNPLPDDATITFSDQTLLLNASQDTSDQHYDDIKLTNMHKAPTKPSKYIREATQAQLLNSGVDREVIEAINEHEKQHDKHAHQFTKMSAYLDEKYRYMLQEDPPQLFSDEIALDDQEDDDKSDSTLYMDGISWPNPDWESARPISRILQQVLWILTFPLSLLRWLSIPATDIRPDMLRAKKQFFTRVSPIFLSLALCLTSCGFDSDKSSNITRAIIFSVGVVVAIFLNLVYAFYVKPSVTFYNRKRAEVRLHVDSKTDQTDLTHEELHDITEMYIKYDLDLEDIDAKPTALTMYQVTLSFIAFVGSITWMSLLADQIVSILQAIGVIFSIKTSILGLTVLAIGNSIPDLFANISLASDGKIATAYAAMFSAPILSNTFGFALALLLRFIKTSTSSMSFEITHQLILCWSAIVAAIVLHCIAYPLFGFTPKYGYGIALIGLYGIFLVAAVLLEVF